MRGRNERNEIGIPKGRTETIAGAVLLDIEVLCELSFAKDIYSTNFRIRSTGVAEGREERKSEETYPKSTVLSKPRKSSVLRTGRGAKLRF